MKLKDTVCVDVSLFTWTKNGRPLADSYSIKGNATPDSLSDCQLFKDDSPPRSQLSLYHRDASVNVFPYFWITVQSIYMPAGINASLYLCLLNCKRTFSFQMLYKAHKISVPLRWTDEWTVCRKINIIFPSALNMLPLHVKYSKNLISYQHGLAGLYRD
jgi:hypothetical protein